jgi:hypothetical protein
MCHLIAVLMLFGAPQPGEEPVRHFESRIRPLLIEKCQKCHGEARQRGGLRLDSAKALLAGGEKGPAIESGHPENSLLVKMLKADGNGDLKSMPPDRPLSPAEIRDVEVWIRNGAFWPETGMPPDQNPKGEKSSNGGLDSMLVLRKPGGLRPEEKKWWTFVAPKTFEPPKTLKNSTWAKTEIDSFLLAKIEATGALPAPRAKPAELVRRIHLNLTGQPPTPGEIDAFLADPSDRAIDALVDRLLESRAHAEAWARKWLDLVRYADSDGYRIDHERPHAWRYRDYVIDSFQENRPIDRFLMEQIAGDELWPEDARSHVAVGFLRHGIYEYNNRDVRGQWDIILGDITDTVGDAFFGLGFQCAKCHDHKYDPILHEDYFRLRAFFSNILPREEKVIADASTRQAHAQKLKNWEEKTHEIREKIAKLEQPLRDSITREAVGRFPPDIQEMVNKKPSDRTPLETQLVELAWRQVDYDLINLDGKLKGQAKEEMLALRRELAKWDPLKPPPLPVAHSIIETGTVPAFTPHPKKKSADIPPGFVTLLDQSDARIHPKGDSTGRRSALAQYLVSPQNPLTARVFVNRVWAWHTGKGLAPQPSDTGRLGGVPTHPELLDWLTIRFVQSGWNLRELHKLIVRSEFYHQSSEPASAEIVRIDPENKLLTRFRPRRLSAEEIRDSMLLTSGELKPRAGGPGANGNEPFRSIHLKVLRNSRNPLFDVFDLPQFINGTASRDQTTTAVQSLFLWNNTQLLDRSQAFAKRLLREIPEDSTGRVRLAFKLTQGRDPTPAEQDQMLEFLARQESLASEPSAPDASRLPQERLPHHEGQAIQFTMNPSGPMLQTQLGKELGSDPFTIEVFFLVRSIADTGQVRTLVSRYDGSKDKAGWSLGITGKGSRRKPQTLVMQLWTGEPGKPVTETAIFSDQRVELNRSYQLIVSNRNPNGSKKGEVRFFLRDLSNPDEAAQIATIPHEAKGGLTSDLPLRLGSRAMPGDGIANPFDGIIDDVRISNGFLAPEKGGVGVAAEPLNPANDLARWTFETQTGTLKDISGKHHDLSTATGTKSSLSPQVVALGDLCHVLFNASGFFHVP